MLRRNVLGLGLLVLLATTKSSHAGIIAATEIQDLEARLEEKYDNNIVDNSVEAMEERLSDLYNHEDDERQGGVIARPVETPVVSVPLITKIGIPAKKAPKKAKLPKKTKKVTKTKMPKSKMTKS